MTHRLAMLIDRVETLNPHTDSSLGILLEAQSRGYECCIFYQSDVFLRDGEVYAEVQQGTVDLGQLPYFLVSCRTITKLSTMHTVFIRIDPPFNREYLYSTYLMDLVAQRGTRVLNHPTGIRSHNEKIFASHFKEFLPPTLVTANMRFLKDFIAEQQKVVIKPVDALAGQGIVILHNDDLDKNSLLELLTKNQRNTLLAQRFLPEVQNGDKRILLIDGEPVPQALLRTPAQNEFRANLAAGGTGTAVDLSARDHEICRALKPYLKQAGLFFVGIDVIGNYLTEINVTCPTGVVVLERLTPLKIFKTLIDHLM